MLASRARCASNPRRPCVSSYTIHMPSRPLTDPCHLTPDTLAGIEPITKPVTLRTVAKWMKAGEKFACLTCYDATTARWLQQAGVPVLLVGDTAAEMILGLPSTIHASLDFLITLTRSEER